MENGPIFDTPFLYPRFYTHSFSGVAVHNWVEENKRSSGGTCQIEKRFTCAKIIDIAWELF